MSTQTSMSLDHCASCWHAVHVGRCSTEGCECGVCVLPAEGRYYSAPLLTADAVLVRVRGLEETVARFSRRILALETENHRLASRLTALELRVHL